ncbi:hypothetical protein Kfla_4099 [Kribbella flavida DSM 17836]|uniref:DUF3159 domain-containing protein n=1 Tax=Kribbella flavida (strain DSM 17836 / JCM 10339 / NBRC 14399) TaxID=479435 RepID=D2PSK8_KRIFD|nr:DUF3159 domain-containing protein [Kribbella flavida]ADB33146.1 hypothetical protein Kfla_4099 [Kribbella flavida DSM 17836]
MTKLQQDDTTNDDHPTTPSPVPETGLPRDEAIVARMGGRKGFVYSAIPVVVFVTANLLLPLAMTISVAVLTGAGLMVFRLVRGERWTSAAGSLVGVAIAAGIVALTGSAKNYFAVGIWANFAGFLIALGSVLARRPVTGLIWNFVHGRKYRWRSDRTVLRAHTVATLAAAGVLGARFGVQQWLYIADNTNALGVARVGMGTPLSAVVALVILWAFRRSTKQLAPKKTKTGEGVGDTGQKPAE